MRYRSFSKEIIIISFLSLVLFSDVASSKQVKETTIDRIEKAYRAGHIDYQSYLVNLAYLVFNKKKLTKKLLVEGELPLKCGNPIIEVIKNNWDLLPEETRNFILKKVTMPSGYSWDDSFESPGGKFLIHYYTSGPDTTPMTDENENSVPDYIEKMAEYFDHVWKVEIDTLNYIEPDLGSNGKLDVYVENLSGVYGYVWGPDSLHMDNDYNPAPKTTDPEGDQAGIMKVTAAHEFHHECQLMYKITKSWYKEATSTWIEDVVYDIVNDYVHYLGRFLQYPYLSLDVFEKDNIHQYGACIFNKFLSEKYDSIDIIRQIWEVDETSALHAIDNVLKEYGSSLEQAFSEFVVWNWFTGIRHETNLPHYEEASMYPIASTQNRHYITSDFVSVDNFSPEEYLPDHLGCNYIRIDNSDNDRKLIVNFHGDNTVRWSISTIKSYDDSYFQSDIIELDDGAGSIFIHDWKDLNYIMVIPSVIARSGVDFEYNYSLILADYGLFVEKYFYFDVGNESDGYISPGEDGAIIVKIINYDRDYANLQLILRTNENGIEISDSVLLIRDFSSNASLINDNQPFTFHIEESYNKPTAQFTLHVVENGNDVADFNLIIKIGCPEILLVDNSMNSEGSGLKGILYSLGFIYDYKDLRCIGIDSLFFYKRKLIIWFSGDNHIPMSKVQFDSIANFLNNGGRLFITGNNFLKGIKDSIPYYPDVFHCRYIDTLNSSRLIGVDYDPVGQSHNDQLWILNKSQYNDRFSVDSDPASQICFRFPGTDYGGIMRYIGDYRFVLADFSIMDLYQPSIDYLSAEDLMKRIMNFLLSQNGPPSVPILRLPSEDTIFVNSVNDRLLFSWSRVIDTDSDTVKYIISFKSSNNISHNTVVADTFYILTTSKIIELFNADWDTLILKWRVIATDDFNASFSSEQNCVLVKNVNLPPTAFSLIEPDDGQLIYLNSEDTTLTFSWQKSLDPEGKTIGYEFFITDTSYRDTIFQSILDTNFIEVDKNLFNEFLFVNDSLFVKWFVISTEGYSITESSCRNALIIVKSTENLEERSIPLEFRLLGNYPNPFNSVTTIVFSIGEERFCSLDIYNIRGQIVRNLVREKLFPGEYRVIWDGRDNNNAVLHSGIYIYVLRSGGRKKIGRMLLLK